MKHSMRAAGLIVLICLMPSTALAQSTQVNPARCYIVSNVFAKAGNEKEKPVAREAAIFYLARLNGSSSQVQAELSEQLKTITNANNGPIMSACAKAMNARAQEIDAAQKALAAAHHK